MIKRDLATYLKDSDAIRNAVAGRVYPNRAIQGVQRPYIILEKLGGTAFNDIPGEADCVVSSIQVTVYADLDSSASNIAELVRNRLSGYSGSMGDSNCISCAIQSPPRDFMARPIDGSDSWIFANSSNYEVFHDQAFATFT